MACTCRLDNTNDIAIMIASLREDFFLSEEEIAILCGASHRTVRRWERTSRAAPKNIKHLFEIKATIRLLEKMYLGHVGVANWLRNWNYWLKRETPLEVIGRREMERVSEAINDQFDFA